MKQKIEKFVLGMILYAIAACAMAMIIVMLIMNWFGAMPDIFYYPFVYPSFMAISVIVTAFLVRFSLELFGILPFNLTGDSNNAMVQDGKI